MTSGLEGRAHALDVAIVNWNSGNLLRDCIAALAESTVKDLNVVVADNASRDNSCDRLDGFEIKVEVIRNTENRGFGAASNQAAARGRAPFLLILNPDTRVNSDTLAKALDHIRAPEHAYIGVLGVRLVDDAGRTQRTCARAPTLGRLLAQAAGIDRLLRPLVKPHFMTEWDHEETRPVDQVMGAFLLIRRELFERLGGFDERFFVYYEDVDLCVRAQKIGAQVVHFAGAAAWHKGGGTTDQVQARRLFYFLRSQALYTAKHFGGGAAVLVLAAALSLQIPARAARALVLRSPVGAAQAVRGGWMLLRDLPALLPALRKNSNGSPRVVPGGNFR